MSFDPRMTPARSDVAALHLEGQVTAKRFVSGRPMQVATALLPLTSLPDPDAGFASQLLMGERFTVYDVDDATGLAWGQAERDSYVGYVPHFALENIEPVTHWITAQITHIYPEPDMKTRPFEALPFLSQINVVGQEGRWLELSNGGYVPARHAAEDVPGGDFVSLCERFVGVPYLWGGKSPFGLDCSALIQAGLHGIGVPCPRDSDQQEVALGTDVDGAPKRGDLVFWKGHVGVMADATRLLHANAFAMAVAYEDFEFTCNRIKAQGDGPVTSIKRL